MDVLSDLDGAGAARRLPMNRHGPRLRCSSGIMEVSGVVVLEILVVGPALRDTVEPGQYHAGLHQAGLVVVAQLGDDVEKLQGGCLLSAEQVMVKRSASNSGTNTPGSLMFHA